MQDFDERYTYFVKERDDARLEVGKLLDRNIKLKCDYRSLEYKSALVETTMKEMTLFDRLMFVVDGYEYLELLFNMKYMKKHPYQ